MMPYPFATLQNADMRALRQERLHALEVSLARVLLQMEEGPGDPTLGDQHDDLVARMAVHRACLGLPEPALNANSGDDPPGQESP